MKDVIFDFGKVIVEFDSDTIMKPYILDPSDRSMLAPIIFDRKYWDKLDLGVITEEDVYNSVRDNIPMRLQSGVKAVLERWYYDLPIFDETVKIIKQLKSNGNRLFLLSNISKTFAESYDKAEYLSNIFSLFDGLVFSGREGIVKPNGDIFNLIIDRYALDVKNTVFIDDSPKNIEGAKAVGLGTFLFKQNYSEMKSALGL